MADKGPFLTSCIIFYLSIGAAIFQILEESNWDSAKSKYIEEKRNILKRYTCLTKEDLDTILEVVSEAAGQGVPIKGESSNTWDWPNSVVFAATIVTTIGYGNVAPKTSGGRVFCILYGLCGIPLCLVWISEVGSFFGDRAKRLSQVLIRKGISVKKVQFTCTAIFLLWGLVVHLIIPPFIFMYLEGWTYLEGLYFSFITLTTVGFGDYVAGTNPNMEYPRLYKVCTELWICMGLAWLSLFFSWNVHMVVEAHKVLKKRRQRHRQPQTLQEKLSPCARPAAIDIFNFLSEQTEDYSTVIKGIGESEKRRRLLQSVSRSKSCSDLLAIQTLEHSPRLRRRVSLSEVLLSTDAGEEGALPLVEDINEESLAGVGPRSAADNGRRFSFDLHTIDLMRRGPENGNIKEEQSVQNPEGGSTRFTVSKVTEGGLTEEKDDKG